MKYDFGSIEPKWQKIWQEKKSFASQDHSVKPKF